MTRWFTLLMLVGAMLGLLGQPVAFAHSMPVQHADQANAVAQMSPECAEMMGLAKQKPQSERPCQGMTPDCIAKMGCAVPVALLPPPAADAAPKFRAAVPRRAAVPPLVGRNIGPEPEPPAYLG